MVWTIVSAALFAKTSTIKVLVVSYFPTVNGQIDRSVTHDVGGSYSELKAKTERLTAEACQLLSEGSRFRGYKLPSDPSLKYEVVESVEFKEAIPLRPKVGSDPPLPDYKAIMNRIQIKDWVEQKGVQQVWMWGYHGLNGL